jgi:hypothetical protein
MFDFPASPANGQTYTTPTGVNYYWDAADGAWRLAGATMGAGSNLDADMLDGQHGVYYLDTANHTGHISDAQHGQRGGADLHAFATPTVAGFFMEAPNDGLGYSRKNGTWQPSSGGAATDDNPPAGPLQDGQFWWKASTGALYIWYDDGNSAQWVQAAASPTATIAEPYLFPLADMALRSKAAGVVALNSKADGTGTDVITFSTSGSITTVGTGANITAGGYVYSRQNFVSSTPNVILAGQGGAVYFRPNGEVSTTGQMYIDTNGTVYMDATNGTLRAGKGFQSRQGYQGSYGGNVHNLFYTSGVVQVWVDVTNLGNMTVSSDYRMKKDVQHLKGMWETVKALQPISYTHTDFTPPAEAAVREDNTEPFVVGDDVERWGFIAHELQEALVASAATGYKDAPDVIQSPNPWTVIAALTKALQEAMERIEALEAR